MREFAEQAIIVPDGPFAGERFRCCRQPWSGLWLDSVDEGVRSGRWRRFMALGPQQSGKTLACYNIPLAYHLFELRETVIGGLPDMILANDKWREDISPIIHASMELARWLPTRGEGSRGGAVKSAVKFRNGSTLRFMAGGGGDAQRSGFTARVLTITELDKLDETGGTSREADKVTQMEGRTRAYTDRTGQPSIMYGECTVSTEQGRIWREYEAGTQTQIVCPCPHCGEYVAPEREHLVGWREAETAIEAREKSSFICPMCAEPISYEQRCRMNAAARLVHRGQTIDRDGNVAGDLPETDTLSFRWSAFHNLFTDAGDLGAEEWIAARDPDEDNAEKRMRQFVWALPYLPPTLDTSPIEARDIMRRTGARKFSRGLVPVGSEFLTVGLDLGKRLGHWVAIAWRVDGGGHFIDYGIIEIASDDLGVERGTLLALREFRETVATGWPREGGELMQPDEVWIDSGWSESKQAVYAICHEEASAGRFRPALGRGEGQQYMVHYSQPKSTGAVIRFIGEQYHISRYKSDRIDVVEINSDHWKSFVHERLRTPLDEPGGITVFDAPPHEHTKLAKHLTAEKKVEEFPAGRPPRVVWKRISRANHYFDAAYMACAAGHFAGVRLLAPVPGTQTQPERPQSKLTLPDGRPFFAMER